MKRNSLFEPQRQSIYAIILILIKFIKLLIKSLWPMLIILFVNFEDAFSIWVTIGTILIGVIAFISSAISYYKFKYYIKDNQLLIERGLLRKTSLNLPFERIQTVDFEQSIIHQILRVVRVNIDSAGAKGSEISFDALSMDQAKELRDYILAQKASTVKSTHFIVHRPEETEELILQLTPKDLLKIGISQNHFRTAGIIFAAMWALMDNVNQVLEMDIAEMISQEAETFILGSFILILIFIPVFLIISFLFTLIRTVIKYFNLRFTKTASGFKLVSGLFTRKEKSAQKNKIQIIAWSDNPIKRLFKMFTMHLYQASSVEVIGGKAITVPGVYQKQIDDTLESVIPGVGDAIFEQHHIHPLARFRFILFGGFLPCLPLTITAIVTANYSLFWMWLYFPFAIYMAHLYYKKRMLQLHPDYIISSGGIFGTKHKVLEIYKIQSVNLSQSFYQWRKDLATVTMYTASGDVHIPFIPYAKANQIRDYLLYRIEVDGRKWM